jgi:hypothetical protein
VAPSWLHLRMIRRRGLGGPCLRVGRLKVSLSYPSAFFLPLCLSLRSLRLLTPSTFYIPFVSRSVHLKTKDHWEKTERWRAKTYSIAPRYRRCMEELLRMSCWGIAGCQLRLRPFDISLGPQQPRTRLAFAFPYPHHGGGFTPFPRESPPQTHLPTAR